jgi:ribonuclease E
VRRIEAPVAGARNGLSDVAAATLDAATLNVGVPVSAAVVVLPAPAAPLVPAGASRTPEEAADAEPPDGRPARRRGRVTRDAGAPAAADGDAPVAAVVTVGKPVPDQEPATSGDTAAEPVAVVTTPRRARRTASRPAGPPTAEAGDDPA